MASKRTQRKKWSLWAWEQFLAHFLVPCPLPLHSGAAPSKPLAAQRRHWLISMEVFRFFPILSLLFSWMSFISILRYKGILVLLALGFLMPSLAYIPKTILASVIITSVIFMVELEELKPMWKSRSSHNVIAHSIRIRTWNVVILIEGVELLPFGVTFLCCLFVNMEYGILIGAGVHLLLLAYIGNRPHPQLIRLPVSCKKKI